MIAVLTGDIINSRKAKSHEEWHDVLQHALTSVSIKNRWEIFRGDSFQAELSQPEKALKAAIYTKACIKTIKGLDVRIAIGIGSKDYVSTKVSESYGDAYLFSGDKFEDLKKDKQNLSIKTGDEIFDENFNLFFKLALIIMDDWTQNSAILIKTLFENENLSQKELGNLLNISQSSISERYNRAHASEIIALDNLFAKRIGTLKKSS